MRRIVISGYHGFDNAGDEAILEVLLQELRAVAKENNHKWQFTVLSASPEKTSKRYRVGSIQRTNPFTLIKAIWKSKAVVSGGGGLLQDVTGRFTVAYYLAPCLLAYLMRKPFIIYAHGIGPLRGKINRLLSRLVLNKAAFISVRDEKSRQLLQEIGVKKNIALTADPAFCLEPRHSATTKKIIENLPAKPAIAVCLRPWPGLCLEEIATTINVFCQETGAAAVIIPFLPQTDLPLSREIAKMLTCPNLVVREELEPAEIIALLQQVELVLAMRLHALIFATVAGTVPVALSYDPKINYYMEQISLPVAGEADNLSRANLLGELYHSWQRKKQLSLELSAYANSFKKQACETAREINCFLANL